MAKKKLTIEDFEPISARDLAYKIKAVDFGVKNPKTEEARTGRRPNLAFFLGAGASKDSGIILASEMMKIFKNEIFEINCPELETDTEKNDWLKEKNWYKDGKKEYGCLFEKFRDTRNDRQRFIEKICHTNPLTGKAVEPSFGYLILADLLLRNYINTVVTTNFDDLVYIASTTFTGNRPIVYAYGILASEMKINDSHSRVLKLHGDFLYSNIVNTGDEMDAKSDAINTPGKDAREIISHLNMERQVRTVLDNFGLIVVGYAGGDETIMKLLEQVSEYNGLYWCYIKDYPPDKDILKLVKSKKGKLVEITGFDDLMKEIADITNFSIDDLLESFEQRKEKLKERITKFDREYTKKSLNQYVAELKEKPKDKSSENLTAFDYYILGANAFDKGSFAFAEKNLNNAIELNPEYAEAYNLLGSLLFMDKNRWSEAERSYRKAIELNPRDALPYRNLGILLGEKMNKVEEAIEAYKISAKLDLNSAGPRVGLAAIYKKLGNQKELKKYANEAFALINEYDYYDLAILNSVLDKKNEALKFLKLAVKRSAFYKAVAKTDPDFDSIRDDERFWEIVGRDE